MWNPITILNATRTQRERQFFPKVIAKHQMDNWDEKSYIYSETVLCRLIEDTPNSLNTRLFFIIAMLPTYEIRL